MVSFHSFPFLLAMADFHPQSDDFGSNYYCHSSDNLLYYTPIREKKCQSVFFWTITMLILQLAFLLKPIHRLNLNLKFQTRWQAPLIAISHPIPMFRMQILHSSILNSITVFHARLHKLSLKQIPFLTLALVMTRANLNWQNQNTTLLCASFMLFDCH